jgi:hypothetical protein
MGWPARTQQSVDPVEAGQLLLRHALRAAREITAATQNLPLPFSDSAAHFLNI